MSSIVLGCDENGYNDSAYQSTVAKILEKAGHTVEKCDIQSNAFASYSDGSNGKKKKKKIGIYLIAAGTYSIADATYGTSKFKYNYFGIRPECSPNWNCSDFDTKPIGADSDCPGWLCSKIAGNSFKKINEIVKEKSMVVTGKDATEMGNNLVKAMGGNTDSSSSKKNSSSSIKDALTDVLYGWDGEAECYVRDDTVYIHKIPSPSDAKLSLIEGENIDKDSVSITDYNPSTVNILTTQFNDYELTIQDDHLIKRFGKISSSVEMDKEIKNLKDAKKFLQREWNKLKRDNEHVLELKTYGHSQWKVGEWCRVYLPSFNIDDYMYISKASQDDSGEWNCNLTLVDYPPGFGEPTKTDNDEENNESDTEDTSNNDSLSEDTS